MSKADLIFIENCRDIIENGVWDTDLDVRGGLTARLLTPLKNSV